MVLVYILILINLVLMISRTNLYFSQGTIQSIIQSGMDVCPLVLGMIFILMLGDIDVSVASIMIFSSMATGLCCSAGLPAFAGVIAGIAAGALCGAFNGFLIAYDSLYFAGSHVRYCIHFLCRAYGRQCFFHYGNGI